MPEMLNHLLIMKALISVGIVVSLSLVVERIGPRAAGLLTGLPLGAGMVIVFTGIEQGTAFAAAAGGHMVPGFMTTPVFIYLYATVAAKLNKGGVLAVIVPAIVANSGYGCAAWLVSLTSFSLIEAIPLVAVVVYLASRVMATLPDKTIVTRVRFGWWVLAFRAGMATAAILIITGIADQVGPQWTGILTAYPITLFPLILVIHMTYAGQEIAAVLKHVPAGLGSVLSFCIVVALTLDNLGLIWGVAAAYAAAAMYLLTYSTLHNMREKA